MATGLTKEQIQQLERTGTIKAGEGFKYIPIPENVDIVYNKSHAVLMVADLGLVFQPHQIVKLSKYFSKERISASQGLQLVIGNGSLVPISIVDLEKGKVDLDTPKSTLEKFEEEHADVIPSVDQTGVRVSVDSLHQEGNPYIEKALEGEMAIEKANQAMIPGKDKASNLYNDMQKKKAAREKSKKKLSDNAQGNTQATTPQDDDNKK